jgi:hypothetical protein
VLSTVDPHYGRPSAAHIMVLMTDGQANQYPGCTSWNHPCQQVCNCSGAGCCCAEDLYSPPEGTEESSPPANDCVMYYAQKAQDNAIVVYTISLGFSADSELLDAVADLTGGFYRGATSPDELDAIFNQLYERIFLRLIQ